MMLRVQDLQCKITDRYWDSNAHCLNFDAEPGSITLIVGSRGTSKTALSLGIGNLIPEPVRGTVFGKVSFDDPLNALSCLPWRAAVLGQDATEWTISDTVFGEIAFTLENAGVSPASIRDRVETVATTFGLYSKLRAHPQQLSGGQKQRLALAAQVVGAPQVVCFDEPFRGLDSDGIQIITTLLKQLQAAGHIIIIFTNRLPSMPAALENACYVVLHSKATVQLRSEHELHSFLESLPIEQRPYVTRKGARIGNNHSADQTDNIARQHSDSLEDPAGTYIRAKSFVANVHPAFRLGPLTFERRGAGITAIMGSNGSGKTSFAKLASQPGRKSARRGSLEVRGHGSQATYYAAQDSTRHFSQTRCVDEVENFGIDEVRAKSLLDSYGIAEIAFRSPLSIARPKQQLLELALAEASGASILFLDEPTSCLDAEGIDRLAQALVRCRTAQRRIFLITHDVEFACDIADDLLVFEDGKIVLDAAVSDITRESLLNHAAIAVSRQ